MINNKGTATIFLITLFAILAGAIGVLLECAKYKGFQLHTKDMLDVAGNSIMAEYYRPLYDDYHIFYLAFSKNQDKEEYMKSKAKESIDYTVKPVEKESLLFKSPRRAFTTPDSYFVEVKDVEMALDNQADLFERQAVSYMKYKGVGKEQKEVEELRKETEKLRTSTEVVEEKLKCEEYLSQKSEQMLKLMEFIDGIRVEEDGDITVKKAFVKRMAVENPSMHSMGVNQTELWTKLQKRYVNVNQLQQDMKCCIQNLISLRKEQGEIEESIVEEEEKTKELENRMQQISEDIERETLSYEHKSKLFKGLIEETRNYIRQALEVAEQAEREEEGLRNQIRKYEHKLSCEGENIEPALRKELQDDIKSIHGITQDGLDLEEIKEILQNNFAILSKVVCSSCVSITQTSVGKASLESAWREVENNRLLLREYDMSKVVFAYGEVLGKKKENPVKQMKVLLSQGIASLVIPENIEISESEIRNVLVSQSEIQSKRKFRFSNISEKTDLIRGLVEVFQDYNQTGNNAKEGIKELSSVLHMLSYEQEHFKQFLSKDEEEEKNALQYEQEYLLKGNSTDKENLYEIIEELTVNRTFFNFISILTDYKKKTLAKETAMAIVGVTGVAPLIHVTETLILLAWSLEEALVDVAVMLQDRSIPLRKSGDEFLIEYEDLISASRELIQRKAKSLQSGKHGLTYSLFLKVQMLLSQGAANRYRCMELINQNMVLRYDPEFRFENCAGQFSLSIRTGISSKFPFLQFAKEIIKKNEFNWSYQTEMQQSY